MPSDESLEAVIHAYDESTQNKAIETTKSAKPPKWVKDMLLKAFDEPSTESKDKIRTLETHDPKEDEPITCGFVVQPKHQEGLLKIFR